MDTAEDQNIKREIFEVIDMNRASLLTGFKQEDLIIFIKVETMLFISWSQCQFFDVVKHFQNIDDDTI